MSAVTARASVHTQVLDKKAKTCKVRFVGQITDCKADDPADKLYDGLKKLICAVIDDYGYMI